MISVAKKSEKGKIGEARLTLQVKDDAQALLADLAVDFTGYGGFKIQVLKPDGSSEIFTGLGKMRGEVIGESLAVAGASEQDQLQITQEVEAFLTEHLGEEPKKEPRSASS